MTNPDFLIDYSQIRPASSVAEAHDGFAARADVVTNYNAWRKDDALAGELFKNELDATTVAIARLEKVHQARLRAGRIPSLRYFLTTHAFDPSQGLRAFLAKYELASYRELVELDDTGRTAQSPGYLADASAFLLRSQVRSNAGTDSEFPLLRTGEYDVAMRGLITIMYRYGYLLDEKVRRHVLHDLLPLTGPHDPGIMKVTFDVARGVPVVGDVSILSVPETENHILMIETSRYLTNQLRHHEPAGADNSSFDNHENGFDRWMLERLQSFLKNDFSEYNSRPYQHYSTMAIQNLFDFATGPVQTAARMVLDYVSAKFAVSSAGLRRAVPFRRRKEHKDQTTLFGEGCDPQTNRFIVLSGATQRMAEIPVPFNAYGGRDLMQLAAISSYRVPDLILDLIVNPARRPFVQRIKHWGVELYAGNAAFLISAGGIWMESDHGNDELNGYEDAGWALPTTLMPAAGGIDRAEFIQIKGSPAERERVNTGVTAGFACGLNPYKPKIGYLQFPEGNWTYIDASPDSDAEQRTGFYVAFYSQPAETSECRARAGDDGTFGFFEAVDAASMTFKAFRDKTRALNQARTFTSEGDNEYTTIDGRTVRFRPNPTGDKYEWGILDGAGRAQDLADWPLASGDTINSSGHDGLVTVDHPDYGRLVLDMHDPGNPERREEYIRRPSAPEHLSGLGQNAVPDESRNSDWLNK